MSKLLTLMVMYEEKGEDDKARLIKEKANRIDDELNKRKNG